MIGGELVAGQLGDHRRITGAGQRHAIGVRRTVEQRRQVAQRDALGLREFALDAGQLLHAHALQLLGIEGGVADDIGHQVERGAEIGLHRAHRHDGAVKVGRGVDVDAQPLLRLGQLHRIQLLRAFLQQCDHQAVGAQRVLGIARIARVEAHRDANHRHRGPPGEAHLDAVRQRRFLDIGEVEIGHRARFGEGRAVHGCQRLLAGCACRHRVFGHARIERRCIENAGAHRRAAAGHLTGAACDFLIGIALTGQHVQLGDGARQPFLHRGGDLGRRHARQHVELLLVEGRIVRIERAFGQRHRLAGKAADLLQPVDPLGRFARGDALHLVGGWTLGDEIGHDGVKPVRDRSDIGTGLHIDIDFENAAMDKGLGRCGDGNRGLLVAHQDIVEPRAGKAAEHGRRNVERGIIGVIEAGHGPEAIEARGRHLVLHLRDLLLVERRQRRVQLRDFGALGDVAEIFLDQRLGLGDIDVARQHENGVVRAVMVGEPLLHVIERGGLQVLHRSDRRMAIGMLRGSEHLDLLVLDQTIGLVVALALLVLHHADLVGQLLLGNAVEQMSHAVAFQEQCAFQACLGDGLEIVGAIEPGRTVIVSCAELFQIFEIVALRIFRSVEHDVFEQMRIAGLALGLVLRADIIPDRNRHDGRLAVLVNDDGQAIGQRELLIGDVHRLDEIGHGCSLLGLGGGKRHGERQRGYGDQRTKGLEHEY